MRQVNAPAGSGRGFYTSIEAAQEAQAVARASARRRKLLRWSAPVVVVLGLAALYLLAICVTVVVGERSYQAQSFPSAVRQFSVLKSANAIETWKPYYNAGTAEYSSGRFFAGTQELGHALTLVPRSPEGEPPGQAECLVRINLSLSYEGLGDEAARATDTEMALTYYEQALELVDGCGTGGGGGGSQEEQESADEAQDRQEQKQDEQREEQEQQQSGDGEGEDSQPEDPENPEGGDGEGEDPSPAPSEGGQPSEQPTTSEQQQELEERNREAQEQREREEQEEGGGAGGGQAW